MACEMLAATDLSTLTLHGFAVGDGSDIDGHTFPFLSYVPGVG